VPESPGFVAHALELLSLVGPVRARSMFGGHGLFLGEVMLGLVDDDEVFLKTDDRTRPRFLAAGCRAWSYLGRGEPVETSYYRPPDEAHEDPEAMLPWAELALEAALRGKAAKRPRAGPPRRKGDAAAGRTPRQGSRPTGASAPGRAAARRRSSRGRSRR
jgi:DNA transformation protein and related proteins